MKTPSSSSHCINVDAATLRAWPLPMPSSSGDKEVRGHVL
ncbi:MAG: ADP-dependent (S)-NAD(P)H-hydrate dehydratase, partial [Massilia sp.]|nr:ADP-dependent (S)-NAD(P)H-hydrate dehydratase [Massilia sp.]